MRSKLFLLAVALCLVLLAAVVINASSLSLEEADLFAYSNPYEIRSGAAGDVYVSDAGVGVWHVSASGDYTLYRVFADVVDARPDATGDIWYTDAANLVGRLDVDEPTPTRTEWVLDWTFGLWGLDFDAGGRVWLVQESGPDLYSLNPDTTELCTYTVSAWSTYVLYQDGDLWTADWGADQIRHLDPGSEQVTSWAIPWSGARPLGLADDGAGGLWWADRGLVALIRLEPTENRMTRYDLPLGTLPRMVEVRDGKVWYTEWTLNVPGTVGVLDPAIAMGTEATVTPVETAVTPECADLGPGTTTEVAAVETGSLTWSSDSLAPTWDQDGWAIYELAVGSRPYGLASSGSYAWASDRGRDKLVRLQPVIVPEPGIDLEKHTNGQDADDPPGPSIVADEPVTWTYAVTNTGNVDLTDVTVTDDNGTPENSADDYECIIGNLAAGATDDTSCIQVATAVEGPYANLAVAVGLYEGAPVEESDASHYQGVLPGDYYVFLPLVLR